MLDFFRKLFDTSDFPARWNCGNWSSFHGFLHTLLPAQEFRTFTGSNNILWESPGNWNPNLVPDSITEGARLDNGNTVVLGSDKVIFALEISGTSGLEDKAHFRSFDISTFPGGFGAILNG